MICYSESLGIMSGLFTWEMCARVHGLRQRGHRMDRVLGCLRSVLFFTYVLIC